MIKKNINKKIKKYIFPLYLAGIPLFIAVFCCLSSMCSCLAKKKESHTNSRRVSPTNSNLQASNSKIQQVSIAQDPEMFAFDGDYSNGGGGGGDGGYEARAQYNYGWDF